MSFFKGRNQNVLDWDQLEKFIGTKMPSFKPDQANVQLPDTSWVEGYVQDAIKNAMPSAKHASSSSSSSSFSLPSEVFETHSSVIVKVTIPTDKNPDEIQVFIKSTHVKLQGVSSEGKKAMIIKLPTLVVPKSGIVRFKQGIMQINMRKRGNKEPYHEAFVQF